MPLKRLCMMFLAPTKLRYTQITVVWPSSAQPVNAKQGLRYSNIQKLAAFVYHLASIWL